MRPTWQFSVAGRQWLVFDGKINLPDGEIYTAPVNKTLNGRIHFELPGVFGGKLGRDIPPGMAAMAR